MTTIPGGGVDVDALFVSNSAETQNGLAYVLGGAWSRCWPADDRDYPYERVIPVVVVFRIPWQETNVQQTFRITFYDEDNVDLVPPAVGALKAGRQPDLTDGASQVVVATLAPAVKLLRPGLYYIGVEINSIEKKRIQFEAIENPSKPAVRLP